MPKEEEENTKNQRLIMTVKGTRTFITRERVKMQAGGGKEKSLKVKMTVLPFFLFDSENRLLKKKIVRVI